MIAFVTFSAPSRACEVRFRVEAVANVELAGAVAYWIIGGGHSFYMIHG
jgi:hypothetical protein